MSRSFTYYIYFVPAKFSTDGTKLKGLHDYTVPIGMNNLVSIDKHPRHTEPKPIPSDKVALFVRWSGSYADDSVIWKVK
jgi:hypothetical protein